MRKRVFGKLICLLLCTALCLGNGTTVLAASQDKLPKEVSIPQASTYLHPFEEAAEELQALIEDGEIQALVYLGDVIEMKELPDPYSQTVQELHSGDAVSIVGVGQDTGYNIWYQVTLKGEFDEVTGYVPRENIACAKEEFLAWEGSFVRSVSLLRRTRAVGNPYADVEQFPASYQSALKALKSAHPNWIFVKMDTGIDWNTLVKSQLGDRSLIHASSPESWKNGLYGNGGWAYASEKILKHYLDPRNGLTESAVFQFEQLAYNPSYHTEGALSTILNGTFMSSGTLENGQTYSQAFMSIGQGSGVSPFLLAARVRQEQGNAGTSPMISGTYKGYEGYYNYYNIGASGKTDAEVIASGLEKAKKEGWNTRYKSLAGGAEFLCGAYVKRGQDTLYLQKFDVDNRYDGVFWHQYMQNIKAPTTEGYSVRSSYEKAGMLNSPYVFRIPVYDNMPSTACPKPGEEDRITLSSTEIVNLPVNGTATLHAYINGKEAEGVELEYISSETSVAAVEADGTITALKTGEATITCQRKGDTENTIPATCKVTVIKADIDLESIELPKPEEVTYDPDQTLKNIVLPKGFTWVSPDMVPTVPQEKYMAVYDPDPENYNGVTIDIPLSVKKAVPGYTLPAGLKGGAGRELSSVSLPKGFYWNQPTELIQETIGKASYQASYNPDEVNYETVTDIQIPLQVVCEKHNFSPWTIIEASCETDGSKTRSCSICGETEKQILPKLGHTYEMTVTKEATEEKEGERTYTCSRCQDSYTEVIPKLPSKHQHSYKEEIVRKASCTADGLMKYICECGDSYEKAIPATGHSMKDGVCGVCGYTETAEPPKDPKPEEKPEQKPETKPEQKPETKPETKPEQKPSETPTPAPEQTTETQKPVSELPETKPEQKPEQKPEVKPQPKPESKPEPKENQSEIEVIENLVEHLEEKDKKEAVAMELNKYTSVSGKVIQLVRERGVNLVLTLPGELEWTIHTDTIEGELPSEIDMKAEIVTGILDGEKIAAVAKENSYLELTLSHEGGFGFEADLTLPVPEEEKGRIANLFYDNKETGKLEYQMQAPVTEEGTVTLTFRHASDYLLVFAEDSMEAALEEAAEAAVITEEGAGAPSIPTTLLFVTVGVILGAILLIIIGFVLYHRYKENEYFDEDVDDYQEKSDLR